MLPKISFNMILMMMVTMMKTMMMMLRSIDAVLTLLSAALVPNLGFRIRFQLKCRTKRPVSLHFPKI